MDSGSAYSTPHRRVKSGLTHRLCPRTSRRYARGHALTLCPVGDDVDFGKIQLLRVRACVFRASFFSPNNVRSPSLLSVVPRPLLSLYCPVVSIPIPCARVCICISQDKENREVTMASPSVDKSYSDLNKSYHQRVRSHRVSFFTKCLFPFFFSFRAV